jgi:hypothetical protein
VSESPPGGAGDSTPTNGSSATERNTSGLPTTAGATGASTVNEPFEEAVFEPDMQSF